MRFILKKGQESASIVHNINKYKWNDDEMDRRKDKEELLETPISTYEVHLGSWRRHTEENNRFLTYMELADKPHPLRKDMGYTILNSFR